MTLRVAVIGCGRMGAERARAAWDYGAEIAAVADADPARADALANQYATKAFSSIEGLPWPLLDAVFVCTPPAYRLEPVRLAAIHGVAPLVEKPLALDEKRASKLLELAGSTSAVTCVGYMNRYRAGLQMARGIANTGSLVGLCCTWSGKAYSVPWWTQDGQSGGPINEQATHMVDLCRYLGGEIADICTRGNPTGTRLAAALTLDNGAIATMFYTCEAREKCISLQLITTAGHVCFSGWDFTPQTNTVDGRLPIDQLSPFILETRAFLSAVESRDVSSIRSDFFDAYQTQIAVDRIRRQMCKADDRPVWT